MEIEWKFIADSAEAQRRALARCVELGWRAADGGTRHIVDTYYDTPDQHFLTSGGSIRKRVENGQTKLTVKGASAAVSGQPFRREEYEGALEPHYFDSRGLKPALTVRNTRRLHLLTLGGTQVELALDCVYFRHQAANAPVEYQVELELKSPSGEDHLLSLGQALALLPGLTAATQNKYQRGMELTGCWRW